MSSSLPIVNIPDYPADTTVIISTGGTIASIKKTDTQVVSPDEKSMYDTIAQLAHDHDISPGNTLAYYPLLNKDSSAFTYQDRNHLIALIQACMQHPNIRAVIVTHGTDTMEETAYATDIIVKPVKPVIFTGAMYAVDHELFDGLTNLKASVFDTFQVRHRTWIRIGEQCVPAQGAYKTSHGFSSYHQGRDNIYLPYDTKEILPNYPYIPIITCTQDYPAAMLTSFLEQSEGVIIRALGSGNLPPQLIAEVKKYSSYKPIALTSRVWNARVYPHYESGAALHEAGVLLCSHITDIQLHVLLEELIYRGFLLSDIQKFLLQFGICQEYKNNYK